MPAGSFRTQRVQATDDIDDRTTDRRVRLFFALWPDEATRAAIAAAAKTLRERHDVRGRWLRPPRYHLTLHFLGERDDLDEDLLRDLRSVGSAVAVAPFSLVLDHAGSFGTRRSVWWLGGAVEPVLPLWRALDDRLRGSDLDRRLRRDARPLVPHVTVLRDAGRPLVREPVDPVHWRVDRFVLVRSDVDRGARYVVLGEWPLAGGPHR